MALPAVSRTIRVLIVASESDETRRWEKALRQGPAPHCADVAYTTSLACHKLERGGWDAVLVDLDPREAGDALRRLTSRFPEIPMLALATSHDEAVGLDALRQGAQDCLVKAELDGRRLGRAIVFAIERKRAQREGLQDALDRFPLGVVLLSEEGRPFLTNRSADEILASGEGLLLRDGQLRGSSAKLTAAVRDLIAKASPASARIPQVQALSIPRRASRRPLSLIAAPLRRRDPGGGRRRGSTVLFISDPERETAGSDAILTRLYGLSRAEARLAWGLMQGKTLKECADRLGVSLHTVRSQLRRILEKTSTSRQAELVRMLVSGPATLHVLNDLKVLLVASLVLAF
jgi:DNA-binding NarL/FixJ family response regulator